MAQSLAIYDCSCCNKNSVCKYEERFQQYKNGVIAVSTGGMFTPFKVDVRCTEFEKAVATPRNSFDGISP